MTAGDPPEYVKQPATDDGFGADSGPSEIQRLNRQAVIQQPTRCV